MCHISHVSDMCPPLRNPPIASSSTPTTAAQTQTTGREEKERKKTVNSPTTPPSPQSPHVLRLHSCHAHQILHIGEVRIELRQLRV